MNQRRHITDDEIREAFAATGSSRGVAKLLGMARNGAWERLAALGLNPPASPRRFITDDMIREAMAKAGTGRGAARLLGVGHDTVNRRLAGLGLKADPNAVAQAISAALRKGTEANVARAQARMKEKPEAAAPKAPRPRGPGPKATREQILEAIQQAGGGHGSKVAAARKLGISLTTLLHQIAKPGAQPVPQPAAMRDASEPKVWRLRSNTPSPELADAKLAERHEKALAMLRRKIEPIPVAQATRLPLHEVYRLASVVRQAKREQRA